MSGDITLATARRYYSLIRSEKRIILFTWALFASMVIASMGAMDPVMIVMAVSAAYFLSLSIYLLNDLMDLNEDRINSPNRPLASGQASKEHALVLIFTTCPISLFLAYMINPLTLVFFVAALMLGLSYSLPKLRAKERFPHKIFVASAGAIISSLTGGAVTASFPPTVFLAATIFSLFALVTLLLGDLADVKGDKLRGVRSFPIVLGEEKTSRVIQSIPLIIFALATVFQIAFYMSLLTPILIGVLCLYCCVALRDLAKRSSDYGFCRVVKGKMRTVHLMLQLSLMIGVLIF